MEPGVGIEPTTYALQVRSRWRQAESSRDSSTTVKGFVWFTGTRWNHTEASGFTTKLTTLSDIHRSSSRVQWPSLLMAIQLQNGLVIYKAPAPNFLGTFPDSCAAVVPDWFIILSDIWTNIPASLSDLLPQSSARWIYWRDSGAGPAARSFVRRLSSTLRHDFNLFKPKMTLDIDEYLLGRFLNSCW